MQFCHRLSGATNMALASAIRCLLIVATAAAASFATDSVVPLVACVPVLVVSTALDLLFIYEFFKPLRYVLGLIGRMSGGDVSFKDDPRLLKRLSYKDELGMQARGAHTGAMYRARVAEGARRIQDGYLDQDLPLAGPGDNLGKAFNVMLARLRDLVGGVQTAASSLAASSQHLDEGATEAAARVREVATSMRTVAEGIDETSQAAMQTSPSMAQLAQAIDAIARGATEQARQVQSAGNSADEMAAGIERSTRDATSVASASVQMREAAENGAAAVAETSAMMGEIRAVVTVAASTIQELGQLGDKIGLVVETIDDIAEQTNLLALNAAIEAARAGDHGKGFAVVADEVRKLAERSGRETKAIAELIERVQGGTSEAVRAIQDGASRVQQGTKTAEQAGRALDEILNAVRVTVEQVNGIAASAQHLDSASRIVTEAMQSISTVAEESTAATEEMSAQGSEVSAAIDSIAEIARTQSSTTAAVSTSAQQISQHVDVISSGVHELRETATHLQMLVAPFKLNTVEPSPPVVDFARRAA